MSIIDDVTDCVILHYNTRFHANDILSDTDIKARFNFSASAWAAEAEALSQLRCISSLGVRIPQSSMSGNTTPEKIARLVDKLVKAQRKEAAGSARKRPGAKTSGKTGRDKPGTVSPKKKPSRPG